MNTEKQSTILDRVLDPNAGWIFREKELPVIRTVTSDGTPVFKLTVNEIELVVYEQSRWERRDGNGELTSTTPYERARWSSGNDDANDLRRIVVRTSIASAGLWKPSVLSAFGNQTAEAYALPSFSLGGGLLTLDAAVPTPPDQRVDQIRTQILICMGLIAQQAKPLVRKFSSAGGNSPGWRPGQGMDISSFASHAGVQGRHRPVALLDDVLDASRGWSASSDLAVIRSDGDGSTTVFHIQADSLTLRVFEVFQLNSREGEPEREVTTHRIVVAATLPVSVSSDRPTLAILDNGFTNGLPGIGLDEAKTLSMYAAFPIGSNLSVETARSQLITCIGLVKNEAARTRDLWNKPGCSTVCILAMGMALAPALWHLIA